MMNKNITINFDMDGTIADLYGTTPNWLECLMNEDETPYKNARPLVRMNVLARVLNNLQRKGYKVAIVSWLAKNATDEYNERVTRAKKEWLAEHLASVKFDEINIVKYGTPKQIFANNENDILFDDEKPNRDNWTGKAYNVNNIIETLCNL